MKATVPSRTSGGRPTQGRSGSSEARRPLPGSGRTLGVWRGYYSFLAGSLASTRKRAPAGAFGGAAGGTGLAT